MIAYHFKNNIYLNITNACTMRCPYCIRDKWGYKFRGHDLGLKKEPTYTMVIRSFKLALSRNDDVKEVVFCGYGEPTIRIGLLKRIARYLKQNFFIVRINTNGHGNLIHKRNIVPELAGLIDSVSVSVNAENPGKYYKMNHPRFGRGTFLEVLSFIKECKKHLPEVMMTTVAVPGVDLRKCKKMAGTLGVAFQVRPFLE